MAKQTTMDLNGPLIDAYHNTLRFEFDRSNLLIENQDPQMGTLFMTHLNEAMRLFISEDEFGYGLFKQNSQTRVQELSSFADNPYQLFYIAEIKLHETFLHLKFGEELSAAWSFRQSFRATRKIIDKYPEFQLHIKTLGIQQIIIGSAPEKHQWLLRLLGFEGTVEDGLRNMESFSKNAGFRKLESDLTLAFIYSHLLQNEEQSLAILETYKEQAKSHPLVNYSFISILSKLSRNEEAYAYLSDFQATGYKYPFPFVDYLEGNLLLQRGDYRSSIKKFIAFIEAYKGRNYRKDANYKTGIAYYLLGQEDSTTMWFLQAKSAKPMVTEADRYASQALNTVLPDKRLIQVRLYTDGGYYTRSEHILSKLSLNSLSNPRDQIEFNYRWARLLHKSDQLEKSIPFYEDVIELTYTDQWYFAPNSALQLGYIYMRNEDFDLAQLYLQKSLAYNNHPYKNSIDNKAKAALSRLKSLRKNQD